MIESFTFHLVVSGFDIASDDDVNALEWSAADMYPAQQGSLVTLSAVATRRVKSAPDFVRASVRRLGRVLPRVSVLSLDQDLVAATDIANRIERSREVVRLWSMGERGPGGFPTPLGTVNGGRRVWDWASVNEWLCSNTDAGRDETGLSRFQYAVIDAEVRESALAQAQLLLETASRSATVYRNRVRRTG